MDLIRNVTKNSKTTVYFSRDHGFEVTVKMCENKYFPCFDP